MAEEKQNLSQKFNSGQKYNKYQTDYASILKQFDEKEKSSESEEKTVSKKEPAKKPKPTKNEKEEKFKAILAAAINRDEEDEEDAFEQFGKPSEEKEQSHLESVKAVDAVEVKEPEVKVSEEKQEIEEVVKPQAESQEEKEEQAKVTIIAEETPCPVNEEKTPEPEIIQQENIEKSHDIKNEEIISVPEVKSESDKETEIKKDSSEKKGVIYGDERDNLKTLDELLNEESKDKKIMTFGKTVSSAEMFLDGDMLEKGKEIKKQFNPNPPAALIAGKDFNDPYLDDIYNYTYPEQIAIIRARKAEQRQKRLESQIAEEERIEELKNKKQKRRDEKKKKTDEALKNIKPKKPLKVPAKYPKVYEDPTDEEIDEKTGKPYHYFNFTKTLENSKLRFLGRIIPTAAIDDVLYDKGFLDGVADHQHDKAIRLNNMSAEEQYSRDLRNMGIKIAMAAVFVFAVFWKITFGIIPDNKYDTAIASMDAMDYESAYYEFTELGNKELSVYFAKYSEAKMLYKVGKYEEAKEAFTLLLPFEDDIFKKRGMKITDEVNECSYQIALSYYYDGDFETAKNIFKEIYTYSDSTQRYYECGFKIAKDAYEDYQDIDDLKKALKYFYRVRKYSSEDITGYIQTIQNLLYEQADSAYKAKEYETAIDLFSYLSLFNYTNPDDGVNSKEMVSQCTYRYGLDLYKNRKYESARKVLSEIPAYKDSYVLSKECIYNIARILYENNPVGSIAEYNKIIGYKDSSDTLYSSRLVIYGQWKITEMNGSSITPVEFSFFDDGQFKTSKQIISVAISTDASPIYYEWDGEKFVAETSNGQYTIVPSYDEETGKASLTCTSPTQSTQYKATRIMDYEEMIISMDEDNKTETAQETMNQKYQSLINAYVEKKLDNIVTMNGEDINIFEGQTD